MKKLRDFIVIGELDMIKLPLITYNIHGTIHEKTTPYSPKINSKVERKNKTLYEFVGVILLDLGAALYWWGEIIQSVCYVLNRIPKSKNTTAPYEVFKNKKPNLSYFRTWLELQILKEESLLVRLMSMFL